MLKTASNKNYTVVKNIKFLNDSTYILILERNNIPFEAGQFICLGIDSVKLQREYTIYNGENDLDIEILIKEVTEGFLSKKLKMVQPGQKLLLDGPFGNFTLKRNEIENKNYYFIATGTGIAPFRSFIRTYPEINYQLLFGVRTIDEAYEIQQYKNYTLCTSRDNKGDFKGRVTEYLKKYPPSVNHEFYICGNGNMVYEVNEILLQQNIPSEQIHFEIYF